MEKFEDLNHAFDLAMESGESLFLWLDELRSECIDDEEFKTALQSHFIDLEGVYEYWVKMYEFYYGEE